MTGKEIKRLREKKGLTQAELAEKAGVSERTIQNLESGKMVPRPATMKRILDVLEIDGTRLTAADLAELETIARDAACAGGIAAMGYYRAALYAAPPHSVEANPPTAADFQAAVAILRSLRPAMNRFTDARGKRFCIYAEELAGSNHDEIESDLNAYIGGTPHELVRNGTAFSDKLATHIGVLFDSLDGTRNFTAGLPLFCSAVAIFDGAIPRVAAIYDPIHHIVYYGSIGPGQGPGPVWIWHVATGTRYALNIRSMSASGLIGAHVSRTDADARQRFLPVLNEVCERFKGTYLLNTGQLALAYVAAGSLDGFLTNKTHIWDTAAGEVLVRAAGGRVTDGQGQAIDYATERGIEVVAAASGTTHEALLAIVKKTGW